MVADAAADPVLAAVEKGKRPVVGVEHHLLALARIGAHEQHAAVAEPDMRHLDRRRHAVQHDDLMRPVELLRLARRKAQRHIDVRRRRAARLAPGLRIAPHRVIAAGIAETAQVGSRAARQRSVGPWLIGEFRCFHSSIL